MSETVTTDNINNQYWRLNNLYYIQSADGKKIKFELNAIQDRLYHEMWYCNNILKSRQHGITTFVAIYTLDTCIFNSNQRGGFIAHNREDAKKIFRRIIKFAYDNLPDTLRTARATEIESSFELQFNNDSFISVGTSMRSDVLQILHVSEYGKICAKYPDKAKEIATGAFNAVHPGQMIFVESTAEGREGRFYDMCIESEKLKDQQAKLTRLDFKFHFYGWFDNPLNTLSEEEAEHSVIYKPDIDYFNELESKHKIKPNRRQKAWYVARKKTQGEDMLREHPSTAAEAFKGTIEGAYFKKQLQDAYKNNRITSVPHEPSILVNSYWDLGMNDSMAIWYGQDVGREVHFLHYYENNNEGFDFYFDYMRDELKEKLGYRFGQHYGPHDMTVREMGNKGKSRLVAAREQGFTFNVAKAPATKMDGIEASRRIFPICYFDESMCSDGIKCLENFRKSWDDKLGRWKDKPLGNFAIHGADAFQTFALSHEWTASRNTRKRATKSRSFGN